ncbi:MAG: ammonium transporter [Coleofasciculaceae cyanobacterium]
MIDILWLLVCSGLVFLMQPGFMCLESGLTRSKNSINVAVKNLADFGASLALFWAFGYALMFGASLAGWIGSDGFFLTLDSTPKQISFFIFQAMFCGTATTVVSGAVAERMKFSAYLIATGIISGLIYPVFGHWAWNRDASGAFVGWLGDLGFIDFAGSTVVHSVGGWVSLATLLVVGPRLGRFSSTGESYKIKGGNLQLSVLGTMLLWLGWLGFNGGSTLSFNEHVPHILLNTLIAGVAGMMAGTAISWKQCKVPEVESLINGSLAGLVAITGCCHVVTPSSAAIIGAVGATVMLAVTQLFEYWRIDDAVGAVAVHAGAGVWGTLAVALLGEESLLHTDLSRVNLLLVQMLGITVAFAWAFGLSFILLYGINRFFPLRVSAEEEQIGLNVSEHQATTELYELMKVMEYQAQTKDTHWRVPVNPFTEVGSIALHYNRVMDALEEAMTRTEAIVKTATDAIITFSQPNLDIITTNPSAEGIFGYSSHELSNLSLGQLLEWPTDKLSEQKLLLEGWINTGRHEVVGRRADGTCLTLEATITEAKLKDRSFYTGTFRDISERKQTEEALQQAAQTLHKALQLREKNRQLELTLEKLQHTQSQLIQTEKMSSLGLLVAGVAHEINNPICFIYNNLVYAKNYAQDLFRLLQIYQQQPLDISPEIQQQIHQIDLEFLQEDLPKLLDSMNVGVERISEIVQSVQTFSRRDETKVKRVDIHQGIETTILILKNRLKAKPDCPDIKVVKEYGQLPLVECYSGQLNQVFMNLLSNAIDALEDSFSKNRILETSLKGAEGSGKSSFTTLSGNHGSNGEPTLHNQLARNHGSSIIKNTKIPTIRIKTELVEENWVVIKIADNGIGMSEEVRQKLFDSFFTTKPVGKGTGLGLSISFQIIVEKHGGSLECYSAPGEGAEFVVKIPVRNSPLEESQV